MNYNDAKQKFETYLESYDRSNDKVRLKIIHTYGVVHLSLIHIFPLRSSSAVRSGRSVT